MVLYSHPALCIRTVKNRHRKRAHRATQSHGLQSPSKAPKQASKAPKSARLGQRIARQLRRLLGPLFKPHQNGANGPVDSMVKRVVLARPRMYTRSARVNTRVQAPEQVHTGA